MTDIEDDKSIRGGAYQRALNFTYDKSLGGGKGGFHWVFNEGGLDCSVAAKYGNRMCECSNYEMSTIQQVLPSFVYVDVGAWVDKPHGDPLRRRDFTLVCGIHVYLCEFTQYHFASSSHVPAVNAFLQGVAAAGHGVRVLCYLTAKPPLSEKTIEDQDLYLLLGDLHLPPVSWFHTREDLDSITQSRKPPDWLIQLPAFQRQKDPMMWQYYKAAQLQRERDPINPRAQDADIHGSGGHDLVVFLDTLCALSSDVRSHLHFIQTGDMFEMWLGLDYQYQPGLFDPDWIDGESVNRVSDRGLEIIIQNTPVFEAFRRLSSSKLAEVVFIWGNHDAYLKDAQVTQQLGLPRRVPSYSGLHQDLLAEHGHRWDRFNFDNVDSSEGPRGASAAFYFPTLRKAESFGRAMKSIGHPSKERDCYLLGTTLIYLHERFDQNKKTFSIFLMGHSHERQLFRYDIRTKYSLYGGVP